MPLIIVDLEATCWPPGDPRRKQQGEISEIIEIYSAAIDFAEFSILREFHSYVYPKKNPILSQFCSTLTGITQKRIDRAPKPVQFVEAWQTWLDESSFILASWGSFDHRLLSRTWKEVLGLEPSWTHLDIQTKFETCCRAHRLEQSEWYQNNKPPRISNLSLKEALASLGADWQGQAHAAKTDTLAALECLKFSCSAQGFTPYEKLLMDWVEQEAKQGRATYWGEGVQDIGLNKVQFQNISRALMKRGFIRIDPKVGALRICTLY